MAITSAEAVAEIVSTANAATYAFAPFTPTTGDILVVMAMVRGTDTNPGFMTNTSGTALAWKTKGNASFNAGGDRVYCHWARVDALSPASSVYTIDVTGNNGSGCIAYMIRFAGGDISTVDPIRQIKFNSGASTNPTCTHDVAMLTGSGYCAAWMGALSSSDPANVSTPPSTGGGWTEIGDNGFGTPTSNGSGAHRSTGDTSTAITFTAATTTWGMVAVEVYEAGAGPVATISAWEPEYPNIIYTKSIPTKLRAPFWAAPIRSEAHGVCIQKPCADLVSSANAASYTMDTFKPAPNALLVVVWSFTGPADPPSVAGGSLSWSVIGATGAVDLTVNYIGGHKALTGASPANTTIVLTPNASCTGCIASVFQFTGIDLTKALSTIIRITAQSPAFQDRTTANPSLTFSSSNPLVNTRNGRIAAVAMARTSPATTPQANWVEVADEGYTLPNNGLAAAIRENGDALTDDTFTFTAAGGDVWSMVMYEVWAAMDAPPWLPATVINTCPVPMRSVKISSSGLKPSG